MKNPKKILPWLPFYAYDWLSDTRYKMLTREEEGTLLRLIFIEWTQDGLPEDIKTLSSLVGLSPDKMDSVWESISVFFKNHPQFENRLSFENLWDIKQEQLAKNKANNIRAQKGAKARWGKKDASSIAQAKLKHCHTDTDTEPDIESKPEIETESDFARCLDDKSSKAPKLLPDDWQPKNPDYAAEYGLDPQGAIFEFKDWATRRGKKYTKWEQTFQHACRNWLQDHKIAKVTPTTARPQKASERVKAEGKQEEFAAYISEHFPHAKDRNAFPEYIYEAFYDPEVHNRITRVPV